MLKKRTSYSEAESGYTQIVGLNRTAILCNIKDASGGNENISYTWEKKSGSGTWQTISASGKEYSATINAETSFRRKATDGTQTAYSNTVTAYIYALLKMTLLI